MNEIRTLSGHLLRGRVFSAPMAGYTDPPYRDLMREVGCPILFTEMIDSHALAYKNEKTIRMLGRVHPDEHVQIAAGTPALAERALDVLLELGIFGINLNMGCPAKKVVSCGGGSNLLQHPKVIADICRVVRKKAPHIPFSVKFRSGWNENSLNFLEIGKIYEGEGVDFIMLHARTRAQSFSGFANWNHIRKLKDILKIPVIGNGDVVSYESARGLFLESNCDGVGIGRGAVGNPWLYRQAERALMGLEPAPGPSPEERLRVICRHYELILEFYGPELSSHIIRKHLVGYLKGLPGHKNIKEKIFLTERLGLNELKEILSEYFEDLKVFSPATSTGPNQFWEEKSTKALAS